MAISFLLLGFVGFAFGLRFRVLVLAPASGLALLSVGIYTACQGVAFSTTLLTLFAVTAAIQSGYVVGAIAVTLNIKPMAIWTLQVLRVKGS